MIYTVDIPDPFNYGGPWVHLMATSSLQNAREFIYYDLHGTRAGSINPIRQAGGQWVIVLPNPEGPDAPWVEMGRFDEIEEADFALRSMFPNSVDPDGHLRVIKMVMPKRRKEWSPKKKKKESMGRRCRRR